jgi:hypothetical protein
MQTDLMSADELVLYKFVTSNMQPTGQASQCNPWGNSANIKTNTKFTITGEFNTITHQHPKWRDNNKTPVENLCYSRWPKEHYSISGNNGINALSQLALNIHNWQVSNASNMTYRQTDLRINSWFTNHCDLNSMTFNFTINI